MISTNLFTSRTLPARDRISLRTSRPGRAAALVCAGMIALCAPALASSGRMATHRATARHAASRTANPVATIETNMGTIRVELLKRDAPHTVANFIGLATGAKAWTDPATGKLTHRPLYNGTIFHRVIPQFMIQGGDPLGNGRGGPGYQFADEISSKITFDHPGYVAMANAGPNTNGSQFFITTAATPWLNGHYNLFGRVISGQNVADKISLVARDQNDRPLRNVVIERILITPGQGK